jgi:transcriptional regulator with XRE-family HTH domain
MRRQHLTYRELAQRMGVSEVSVKRYLSQGHFNLDTLDRICGALGASLEELFEEQASRSEGEEESFTPEQEQALAKDELLFAAYYLVGDGWEFAALLERLKIKEAPLTRLLIKLERLGLVEYRSNEDIRIKVSTQTPWKSGGPLWQRYKQQALQEFFNCLFLTQREHLRVTPAAVFEETAIVIRRMLERVQKDIRKLVDLDHGRNVRDLPRERYWFITAIRPIQFSAIHRGALPEQTSGHPRG